MLRLVPAVLAVTGALAAQALRFEGTSDQFAHGATFDPARGTIVRSGSGGLLELVNGQWRTLPTGLPESGSTFEIFPAPGGRGLLAVRNGNPIETWACDMVGWRQLAIAPPTMPDFPKLAYDAGRDELLYFAGFGFPNPVETWVFDGSSWIQRQPTTSPPGSVTGVMAYDSVRQRVVLLTGGAGPETWEWDGTDWQQVVTATTPPPRGAAGMTFDSARARIVLVGGTSQGQSLQDCWEYDGTDWTQAPSLPGAGRADHEVVFDRCRRERSSSAASKGSSKCSTRGGSTARRGPPGPTLPPTPRARVGTMIAVEPGGQSLLLYGGASMFSFGEYVDETWRYDASGWTQLNVAGPQLLFSQAPAVQDGLMWTQQGQVFLLFGYQRTYSGSIPTWTLAHGQSSWNGTAWTTLSNTTLPPLRRYASLAFDVQSNEAVLFGGETQLGGQFTMVGDTWTFDGTTWQQRAPANSPTPRIAPAMAYDPVRDRVVLVGGFDGSSLLSDTWEWDGTDWLSIPTATQPDVGTMTFDPILQRVVMLSDLSAADATMWTFDGVDWTPAPLDAGSAGPGVAIGDFAGPQGSELLVVTPRIQRLHRDAAEIEAFGSPCAADAVVLSANAWPDLGEQDLELQLTYGPANSFAALAGSSTQLQASVLGCTLLVDPTQALALLTTSAIGRADFSLPVPNNAALLGLDLYFQAMAPSASAPQGLALSRGCGCASAAEWRRSVSG